MIHTRSVLRLLAYIHILVAALMSISLIMAFYYGESEGVRAFGITEVAMLTFSLLLIIGTRGENIVIKAKDSYLLVTLTWVLATAFGALPLYLSGTFETYPQCYFEIMSGFTTTGATALSSIEDKMKSILFWRNMTNWLGGMGIVVLFVALLPFMGTRGTSLVGAESVGPTKDKLTPKIQHTAFALWAIYAFFSLVQTLLLWIKIPLFDAVTVMFGTMGAAGFSPRNSSIGSYHSAYVDIVVTIFMIIAGSNFALYFKVLKGRWRDAIKDAELRQYLLIITVFTLLITLNLNASNSFGSFFTAMRYAAFHVASIITTTGFATFDYNFWPAFSKVLLVMLFFVGGCAGSAGGGIKVIRISMLLSLAKNAIRKRLHPEAVTPLIYSGSIVKPDVILSVAGFVAAYILTGLIGTLLFSLSGYGFETCFTASFLLLGNIGIGMADVGPSGNFSIFSDAILSVGSFLMLVGRLELFTVYALFTRSFWKR